MEAIKCPNCGSEKIQALSEEKYVCLACDNEFLVHNLSKEFRQTDEHITDMHADIKKSIQDIRNIGEFDEQRLIDDAEEHLKKQNYETALKLYAELSERFPSHYTGWYGIYKVMTRNFTYVENYAEFLCGGNYLNSEDEDPPFFLGFFQVRNALSCEDANKEEITSKVKGFLSECAEYGKKDVESDVVGIMGLYRKYVEDKKSKCDVAKKKSFSDRVKALMPSFPLLGLILILVFYALAADWLGKIIGIVGVGLVLKFGGRRILRSFRDMLAVGKDWKSALSDFKVESDETIVQTIGGLQGVCIELDNYSLILKDLLEDSFMVKYLSDSYDGMKSYDSVEVDEETFISDFLNGKYEKYNYLISSLQSEVRR